jgi:peptidoglycan/LPS O-acetylase OafA/YrhL
MAAEEHTEPVAQHFVWPVAVAAATTIVGVAVTVVLDAAVKQHLFWAGVAIACLAVLVAWLTAATRAGAAARRRIDANSSTGCRFSRLA